MTPFRNRPIKQKLLLLILITTTASLLLSGLMLVVIDAILFRADLKDDLATFSQVIADNSTASLAFNDPNSASEVLGALRSRTHVMAACLFLNDASLFADYVRDNKSGGCGPSSTKDDFQWTWKTVTVGRPVVLKGQTIGRLTIVYDLRELSDRIRIWGGIVLSVLVLSGLTVPLMSSRLRKLFVNPILELARVTAAVSQTKNYAVRAEEDSKDEVGQLATAFNQMLAGIESRDANLRTTLQEREQALERLAQVNTQLQQSNEELARSNQDLERFAFIASHDMQEPLRTVTIYSQLLVKQCGDTTGELATYRDYIVAGTTRMRDLIADLLSYMEITSAPPHTRPVDTKAAVDVVRQNLKLVIQETGTSITTDSLPVVAAQEAHIVSLLQNLISNAIKYRSEQTPLIHISANRMGPMYRFAVTDNGIGIAPEYHMQIFLAFKRLHGKGIPGTGIGLAICQRIVERYGGRIWVESVEGQGASFQFTLPVTATEGFSPDEQESA